MAKKVVSYSGCAVYKTPKYIVTFITLFTNFYTTCIKIYIIHFNIIHPFMRLKSWFKTMGIKTSLVSSYRSSLKPIFEFDFAK